jgi:hypothetical protein
MRTKYVYNSGHVSHRCKSVNAPQLPELQDKPRNITVTMLRRDVLAISVIATILLTFLLVSKSALVSGSRQTFLSRPDTYLLSVEPHLNAKLAHAEQLWQQAVEGRKEMVAAMGRDRDFPDGYIAPYNVWDFARPSFYCPHDLERVGTLGDGGKIVCGMTRYERECPGPASDTNLAQELIVYSFGVSGDSSFEAALLQSTNSRIWGYDYSVDSWAKEVSRDNPFAHFNKVAIDKVTDRNRNPLASTIRDLMKANGHSYVDLVKMDIEGAEFDALTSLIESVREEQGAGGNATLPFGQLLVEIHFMDAPPGFAVPGDLDSWMQWWSSLEEMGLRPVNNEDNWIGDVGSGKPRFMEVRCTRLFAFFLF